MNKKLRRIDESGVSEVVGTILVMSITVALFSSIFAAVSMMEGPDHRTYIELDAMFFTEERDLRITHKGGRSLDRHQISFNIIVYDGSYLSTRYDHLDQEVVFPGDTWQMGQDVRLDLEELPGRLGYDSWDQMVESSEVAELIVIDTHGSEVIWRTNFNLGTPMETIFLKETGVEYPHKWARYVVAGDSVKLYARLGGPSHLLDEVRITVDLSPLIGYNDTVEMTRTSGDRFIYPDFGRLRIDPRQENGTYLLRAEIADIEGVRLRDEVASISLNVGPLADDMGRPHVRFADELSFQPRSPLNGQSVTVYVVLENVGGSPARFNVTIRDRNPRGVVENVTLIEDMGIPSGGSLNLQHTWTIRGSGTHDIIVNVTDISSPGGTNVIPEPGAESKLYVQPTILLVDDDKVQHGGDATVMADDLEAAGFVFEHYRVDGRDGPPFSGHRFALNNYDIVIWMTGDETLETLTESDQDTLEEFLEDGRSLWLIGSGIGDDLGIDQEFMNNYLGTSIIGGSAALGAFINGVDVPLYETDTFETVSGNGHILEALGDANVSLTNNNGDPVAVSYENDDHGSRTMFNSFLFSSIEGMPGDWDEEEVDHPPQARTNMVYKVINWLGGIEFRGGSDIAVAEQRFSTESPMYLDTVRVTGLIRNNGQENLTNIDVRLKVNGEILTNNAEENRIGTLYGMGGTHRVQFNWTAEPVGKHEILIVVDPFNRIDETNLENNDIRYKEDVNTYVNVRFSILVVDDDASEYSDLENTTAYVTESLDRLDYSYDIYFVDNGADGPDESVLQRYNSIFWVFGHSDNSLSQNDIEALRSYLGDSRTTSLMLVGNYVLGELVNTQTGIDFLEDYMGIEYSDEVIDFPERLYGSSGDPIGHGLAYDIYRDIAELPDTFNPIGADVLLKDGEGNNIASSYDSGFYRTVFLGVDPFHLDGPIYEDRWYADFAGYVDTSAEATRQELIYMITKWFGNIDQRAELRVSALDIEVENNRPMLRRSYLLTATIHNVGHSEARALIRFKDGYSLIGSESIYVPPDGVSTAEVMWEPLYAGPDRPIRVLVDPLGTAEEIGETVDDVHVEHMGFNNHAKIRLPVYYFWDDMENGTANWRTEATIMNINAENPLDFMGGGFDSIDTDIISDWDYDMSERVISTSLFSHSDPYSYWLQEPMMGEDVITEDRPVDIAFVIDTSNSMHRNDAGVVVGHEDPTSRWYQARVALVSFIENLTEKDRAAVWAYSASRPIKRLPLGGDIFSLAYMTEANRTAFIDHINNELLPITSTPHFDTIGEAIWNLVGRDDYDENDESRLEFVVALTDGLDNSGTSTNWWDRNQPYTGNRTGLLNAPVMIYNIAMTCEPLREHGEEIYPRAPYWSYYTPPKYYDNWNYDANRNLEYWYWKVATSSTSYPDSPSKYGYRTDDAAPYGDRMAGQQYVGRYIYAETGEQVVDLFEEIRGQILEMAGREAETGNVTSLPGGGERLSGGSVGDGRSEPGLTQDGPILPTGRNYNKTAVTPAFDLTGYSTARLTFWHKYKIVPGTNGAFIQVGYLDDNDDWVWRYMIPTHGSYTGNMNMDVDRFDDHGRRMNWAWNGVSGGGTFGWDHVQVNLMNYVPEEYRDNVRVRFNYTQYGSGTGYGWFLDDVRLTVSRAPGAEFDDNMQDVWRQVTTTDAHGDETTAWWNGQGIYDPNDPSWLMPGIDNSLVTSRIDLTNALTAELSADFKFNVNEAGGRPPDGLRVEISRDGGISWTPINQGVRIDSGVSGDAASYNWVSAEDVDRLNVDLSDFAGNVIRIRFRMYTNNNPGYAHYQDNTVDFGGFYVNNVIVSGRTLQEG